MWFVVKKIEIVAPRLLAQRQEVMERINLFLKFLLVSFVTSPFSIMIKWKSELKLCSLSHPIGILIRRVKAEFVCEIPYWGLIWSEFQVEMKSRFVLKQKTSKSQDDKKWNGKPLIDHHMSSLLVSVGASVLLTMTNSETD